MSTESQDLGLTSHPKEQLQVVVEYVSQAHNCTCVTSVLETETMSQNFLLNFLHKYIPANNTVILQTVFFITGMFSLDQSEVMCLTQKHNDGNS